MDKKNGHLTTFEVTIPSSVVESLDFMVRELNEESTEEREINRNSVVSYLIQNYFVDQGYYDKFHGLELLPDLDEEKEKKQ